MLGEPFLPYAGPIGMGSGHSEGLITSVSRKVGLKGVSPSLQVQVSSAGTFVFCSGAAAVS